MDHACGEEQPVAGFEDDLLAVDVEHAAPREDGDPLVLFLGVGLGFGDRPAEDLLDREVAVTKDDVDLLTGGGRLAGGAEPPPVPGRRNRYRSVSYSRTTVRRPRPR